MKSLIKPFKGLIRPFKGLIRPFKGLIRLFKGLTKPSCKIRRFDGLTGSPGKNQKKGQEDQGEVKDLGGTP